jgi:hypothetical protein
LVTIGAKPVPSLDQGGSLRHVVDPDSDTARLQRGLMLVGTTAVAAVISLLLAFLVVEPPKYVVRWDDGIVRVADDGRQLHMTVYGTECDKHVTFQIRESPERVKITALVTGRRLRTCEVEEGDRVPRDFAVWLPSPLDDRPLLDGRCTHPEAEGWVTEADCPAQVVEPFAEE